MNKSEQLIACLEGEIAKRDARIADLEHHCGMYGLELTNEVERRLQAERKLVAIKAQEPVAWAGVIEDCASLFVTEPQLWKAIPIYAAPVSEAKAQGVVMPRNIEKSFLEWASAQLKAPTQLAAYMAGADEVARLNAAPAAPAADAGLVLEQAMYALIGIGYHENSGLVHELRQSLAAHRAQGVV